MFSYIPDTEDDRRRMLGALGMKQADELFAGIPEELKFKRRADLPESLSEPELSAHMKRLAEKNADAGKYACFLGAGAYDHFIPSVVKHVVSLPQFYTAYTPYQAEISQGTLQVIFEYQTMICRLTGMDVSNASMYDGATAAAEAVLMAVRHTGRNKVVVSEGLHPEYREVLKTYARFNGVRVREAALRGGVTDGDRLSEATGGDCAAILIQNPNFFGAIEDLKSASELAKKAGALLIACVDPISLAILKTPGECGADIAVGDGQALGNPLSFGGPYFGFMAVKKELMRKMPGRIAGQTTDRDGRAGYVLTLQTREQHIRREKAVSNICSNQALNALAATAYLSVMGKEGLKEVANLCLQKSHYACEKLLATGKFAKVYDAPFFKEFAVEALDEEISVINTRLHQNGITGGYDLGLKYTGMKNYWLVAVTEKRTKAEIDMLAEIASEGGICSERN